MKVLLVLCLTACTAVDVVGGRVTDGGTVYICDGDNSAGQSNEWCWDGSVEELEDGVGLDCHATGLFERTSIVGCYYHCDGQGPGCNAHNGCYCP